MEGPCVSVCRTGPGALYDKCNVDPALTEKRESFLYMGANLGGTAELLGPMRRCYNVLGPGGFFAK